MSAIGDIASSNAKGSPAWSGSWTHFSVERRSRSYCRVTFDHPPTNTITATMVAELAELVGLIEEDQDLNVVVFDSANRDFFLAHYDADLDRAALHAWVDLLVRLARAPVVSIASIRGAARGAGREFVLACDVRFASRENAELAQFEAGARNRVIADDELDGEVEAIAARLARFDREAIARTKSYVDL